MILLIPVSYYYFILICVIYFVIIYLFYSDKLNGVFAVATRKLQMEQMQNKDKRVKMMNEILSGMKVRRRCTIKIIILRSCSWNNNSYSFIGIEIVCLGALVPKER